jgi:DNA-binding transcriptional ArsR family regulator
MELAERARLYAALADPVRLRIVDHLRTKEVACGKELAAELGISVALVSHHTRILEDAGLILRRREGQFSRFSLDSARFADLKGDFRT